MSSSDRDKPSSSKGPGVEPADDTDAIESQREPAVSNAPVEPAEAGTAEKTAEGSDGPQSALAKPAAARGGRPPQGDQQSFGWRGAPGWVVPAYIVGLLLIFAGQRALSALETGATVLTVLGALVVLFSTLVRFSPKFTAKGERGNIEKLMLGLSVLGLIALAIYAATTEWGQALVGIDTQEIEARERVLGVLSVVWISLILIASLPMLFAEASLRPMRRAERPESRRVNAAAGAGLVLALAMVYGALFVFSADVAELKVDYSYFKTSGPSESTKKIARSLQDQVQVTAFFPEVNEVKREVQGYLTELSRAAPKLKIEVTDRLLVPKKARELRATQDGMVVLSKGKVTRSVVVGTELDNSRAKLKTLDQDMQAQLLKLARARRTVYMTVGHGELNDKGRASGQGRSAQILDTLLRKQNYTVKELGLAQGLANEIPTDADIVMVLGPTEAFSPEEAATLDRYVKQGGKLLLAIDPDAISTSDSVTLEESGMERADAGDAAKGEATEVAAVAADPNSAPEKADEGSEAAPREPKAATSPGDALGFSGLLASLGLEYSSTVLANENKHVRRRYNDSDRVMLVTSSFSSHASVSTLSRNAPRAAIVLSGSGSLDAREKLASKRDNKIDFAIRAAPDTFADLDRDYRRDKDKELAKSYNLAAAVSKKLKGSDQKKKEEPADAKGKDEDSDPLDDLNEYRAFVMGDADALSDLVMANVPGNQFLFVDAVRWLGGEESWAGEQSTEEDVRIEHTKKEDQVWFYSTIFGAPALVLGAGMLISKRSRQRRGASRQRRQKEAKA